MKRDSKFFWIIGGGILQKPLLEEAKKLGYEIILTDGDENCICSNLATYFKPIDIFDIDSHIEYASDLLKNGVEIKGVLAAGIDAPETMAKVAESLNLPTVKSSIAHLVNHKELFRQKMEELGFDVPKFHIFSLNEMDQLPEIIKRIDFPLIVKNSSSSGSRGTKIFYKNDINDIKNTLIEAIKVSRSNKALIESLWEGTEHTVETLFDVNGKFHRCFITDREFDKSNGFALETGLSHPSDLSLEEQEEMYKLAEKISRELEIDIGAAKFDMIQTSDGPKVIEMTVRLSGGFDCQVLVPAATGKNILRAAILTSVGKEFDHDLLIDKKQKFACSESLWPYPGKIIEINGVNEAQKQPGFEYIFFRSKIGSEVLPYTDCTKRVCFIIASGKTKDQAKKNMVKIKEAISIVVK